MRKVYKIEYRKLHHHGLSLPLHVVPIYRSGENPAKILHSCKNFGQPAGSGDSESVLEFNV